MFLSKVNPAPVRTVKNGTGNHTINIDLRDSGESYVGEVKSSVPPSPQLGVKKPAKASDSTRPSDEDGIGAVKGHAGALGGKNNQSQPMVEDSESDVSSEKSKSKKIVFMPIGPDEKIDANGLFVKEDIAPLGASAGSSLQSVGTLGQKSLAGRPFLLRVVVHCFAKPQEPMRVEVTGSMLVGAVLKKILKQYLAEKRNPMVFGDEKKFELRLEDEESEELGPDFDNPPFNVGAEISEVIKGSLSRPVYFCRAAGVRIDDVTITTEFKFVPHSNPAMIFVTVANEELGTQHLLEIKKSSALAVIFDILAQKEEVLDRPQWEFFLPIPGSKPLDAMLSLEEARLPPVLHLRKKASAVIFIPSGKNPKPSDFIFNFETAGEVKLYRVIKENRHGVKQERFIRVAHDRILNFASPEEDDASTSMPRQSVSALHRLSLFNFGTGSRGSRAASWINVKRQYREMHDVVIAEMVAKDQPCLFQIKFRDSSRNDIIPYRYEAATPYDAAEIVAKIEFFRNHQDPGLNMSSLSGSFHASFPRKREKTVSSSRSGSNALVLKPTEKMPSDK